MPERIDATFDDATFCSTPDSGLVPTAVVIQTRTNLAVKFLNDRARLPEYATPGSACFDIFGTADDVTIAPGEAAVIGTGLAFEIPDNHVMLVYSRSGHGFKQGLRLANTTGIIDSDYRGELMVKLHNDSDVPQTIPGQSRCAQAMIIPVQQVAFKVVDDLSHTQRGIGGFGSTGTA